MAARVKPHRSFSGVFEAILDDGTRRIATHNLAPGRNIYGERLVKIEKAEYRLWDPFRSKLAAAIMKGLEHLPLKPGSRVLYLGAASGTTASHISDIIGPDGYVYCVEFSARSIRDLINNVCSFRGNMAPILADARLPRRYATLVGKVEGIYCDIAQPEQARILIDNAEVFLRREGWAFLAVKARSIDVTKEPAEVYKQEAAILERKRFNVLEAIPLEPFDKDHIMIRARRQD